MTALENALHRAHAIADRVAEAIEGKLVEKSRRKLLAGAAFQLTVEHHRSIVLLVESQALGSALALQRPLFEAFARGYWLIYQATDDDIDRFAEGRHKPNLEYLRRMLVEDNPGGPSHADIQRFVSVTHDLTHGGIGHLIHRMSSSRIGPSYGASQIISTLDAASWLTAMAALDLVGTVIEDATVATALAGDARAILGMPVSPFPRSAHVTSQTTVED